MNKELIQCVRLEMDGEPYIVGEFAELPDLLAMILPAADDIEASASLTITFPRMTRAELNVIPEFEG